MSYSEIIAKIQTAATQLPPFGQDSIFFYGANLIIFLVVGNALNMIFRLLLNKTLSFTAKPYSTPDAHDRRILILGDSTAVGTGAAIPQETLAGRLARDYPNSQIVNLGKNGGLIRDVEKQLRKMEGQTFDMIIISAGGNDVWHLTPLRSIRKNLERVFERAKQASRHRVIFLMYNNIGSAPIFPFFIRFFLRMRAEKIQETIREVASRLEVPVVDLFTEDTDNPFLRQPDLVFASDGIHPNSRGYEMWYNRMWRTMAEAGFRY
jgi:lysophospholipase L1-like esterase